MFREQVVIYKIDHLAFGTDQFDKDIHSLKLLGYRPAFIERNAKNMENTREIMQPFSPHFNFSLCTSESNLGIEVLDYGHLNETPWHVFPIFENLREEYVEYHETVKIDTIEYCKGVLKSLNLPVYYTHQNKGEICFNKIVSVTHNVIESAFFWELFRFKIICCNSEYAVLEFTSLFPKKTSYLYLINGDIPERRCLIDGKDFHKIALISNSAQDEKRLLEEKGYSASAINSLKADGKTLDIFFSYGPSSELVEIVGLQNS